MGVDALPGRQTRPHKGLDIAPGDRHLVRFEGFLASRGIVARNVRSREPSTSFWQITVVGKLTFNGL
ncbi:MAG: nucleotidyltransferase domain-containing protein [Acidobacteriota bacterium]